jgi:hypothetical protein
MAIETTRRIGPSENIVDAIEEYIQTVSVRKIWVLTHCINDARAIRRSLDEKDYTVAHGPMPSGLFMNGFQNTLVTDWDSYAMDQNIFRDILPSLDIIVLDGMSELNMCSWQKWVENTQAAGWKCKPAVLITA